MIRTIAAALLLAGLWTAPLAAQSFRCRTADGGLVFTDDPGKFPPGCREEAGEPEGSRGGVSIIPVAPPPPAAPLPPSRQDESVSGEKAVGELKREALALAAEYRETVARRVGSLPPAEVQKARENTVEIFRRRDELRQRLAAARLSAAEKAEIEGILAEIADTAGY
jgi:hypothetical protein